MQFITEDDLRGRYKQQPFVTLTLADNERLTPGARQFIMDRRITLVEKGVCALETALETPPAEAFVLSRLQRLESECLLLAGRIIADDASCAEALVQMAAELRHVQSHGLPEEEAVEAPQGPTLTAFHMQLPNAHLLLQINVLDGMFAERAADLAAAGATAYADFLNGRRVALCACMDQWLGGSL